MLSPCSPLIDRMRLALVLSPPEPSANVSCSRVLGSGSSTTLSSMGGPACSARSPPGAWCSACCSLSQGTPTGARVREIVCRDDPAGRSRLDGSAPSALLGLPWAADGGAAPGGWGVCRVRRMRDPRRACRARGRWGARTARCDARLEQRGHPHPPRWAAAATGWGERPVTLVGSAARCQMRRGACPGGGRDAVGRNARRRRARVLPGAHLSGLRRAPGFADCGANRYGCDATRATAVTYER